jgi:hypothetical protein
MKYQIEKISGDNWRPEMPQEGWLVRYELWQYGWKYMKTFASKEESESFVESLKERGYTNVTQN